MDKVDCLRPVAAGRRTRRALRSPKAVQKFFESVTPSVCPASREGSPFNRSALSTSGEDMTAPRVRSLLPKGSEHVRTERRVANGLGTEILTAIAGCNMTERSAPPAYEKERRAWTSDRGDHRPRAGAFTRGRGPSLRGVPPFQRVALGSTAATKESARLTHLDLKQAIGRPGEVRHLGLEPRTRTRPGRSRRWRGAQEAGLLEALPRPDPVAVELYDTAPGR